MSSEKKKLRPNNMLGPRMSTASRTPLIEPEDDALVQLLGCEIHDGLAVPRDAMKRAMEWAGCDSDERDYDNALELAGAKRNTLRAINFHGMRMMLYLAKHRLLETNEDPVQWLAGVLADSGFDTYWPEADEVEETT